MGSVVHKTLFMLGPKSLYMYQCTVPLGLNLFVSWHLLRETQICGHCWTTWSSWRCFCSLHVGWTRRALKVPSNPIDSVVLWLYFLFITMLIKRLLWKLNWFSLEICGFVLPFFLTPSTLWHREDGFSSPVSHLCLAATGHIVPWQVKCESPWRLFLLSPRYQNMRSSHPAYLSGCIKNASRSLFPLPFNPRNPV